VHCTVRPKQNCLYSPRAGAVNPGLRSPTGLRRALRRAPEYVTHFENKIIIIAVKKWTTREKSAYTTGVYFGTVFPSNTPNFRGSLRSPESDCSWLARGIAPLPRIFFRAPCLTPPDCSLRTRGLYPPVLNTVCFV